MSYRIGDQPKIKIATVAYHRNGVGGKGFHVVLFYYLGASMIGIVFDEPGRVAVLDVEETAKGNIAAFEGNSWRGDLFEGPLRRAVADFKDNRAPKRKARAK